MAFGPRFAPGLVCANECECGGGANATSVGFMAAGRVAVGGIVRGSWVARDGRVCADRVCDCCCVRVVQKAAAAAGPRGQRRDGQSLLDESSDVLHCLRDQGAFALPVLFLLLLLLFLILCVTRLGHSQLPACCRFRGGALPFAKRGVGHGRVEVAGPHTSHGLVGRYLRLFGLTGSYVVGVTAPHGFGGVVRSEKAVG